MMQPVALVTGGSRGIGRGICQSLAQAGFDVAVNYRGDEASANDTLASLAREGMLIQGDVGVAHDRSRMVDAVLARWGRIDVLVNNAGITSVGRKDLLEATDESWDQVMAVNLKGPFFLSQRVSQEMIRLGIAGTIVNVSSVSAYALSTNRADYCISKAGVGMMTQLFALRLADHGIRVYEIRPGIIETDMTSGGKDTYTQLIAEGLTPIRRWGSAGDVGQAVAMLAGGALGFSTGDVFNIDGGYHLRKFPR